MMITSFDTSSRLIAIKKSLNLEACCYFIFFQCPNKGHNCPKYGQSNLKIPYKFIIFSINMVVLVIKTSTFSKDVHGIDVKFISI